MLGDMRTLQRSAPVVETGICRGMGCPVSIVVAAGTLRLDGKGVRIWSDGGLLLEGSLMLARLAKALLPPAPVPETRAGPEMLAPAPAQI